MKEVKTRKKYLIHQIEISKLEPYRQFEIRLPANIKKVTGIVITATQK